jgi:hypothetical protein
MTFPEGVIADLHIYLVSELEGEEVEVVVSLRGFRGIPAIAHWVDLPRLVAVLQLDIGPLDIEKTRLMTTAEIASYQRSQRGVD